MGYSIKQYDINGTHCIIISTLSPTATEVCSDSTCLENVRCLFEEDEGSSVASGVESGCQCSCNDGFQCSETGDACEGMLMN